MSKKAAAPEMWPIEALTPYRLNVKKHEKDQVSRIAESMSRFGWKGNPIIVDADGVIIAGHGRRLAAIEIGMKEVPVVIAKDLTPEQVRAYRLADNRVAQGDIDGEMLKLELSDIDSDFLLKGIFDDKELDYFTADLGAINEAAFVDDMGEVLAEQKREMDVQIEKAAEGRVPLSKAFGFKDIPADAQIHITRLMAKATAATGLEGPDALAVYAASL